MPKYKIILLMTQGALALLFLLVPPTWAITPEQDFANRCAAAGVIKCQGFDTDTDVFGTHAQACAQGTGTMQISRDTTTRVSGASSLLFTTTVTGPCATQADIAGLWQDELGNGTTTGFFGQNSTFYMQVSYRYSPEMFSNFGPGGWTAGGGASWKNSIIYGDFGSCSNMELTNVVYPGEGSPNMNLMTMYSQCGNYSFTTDLNRIPGSVNQPPPYLLQQGASATSGYNCPYGILTEGTGNGVGCFNLASRPNTWITLYYQFQIGTYGSANSNIRAYYVVNGQYLEWLNVQGATLAFASTTSDVYHRLFFTPYITRNTRAGLAPARWWIDEWIVSTQPIAVPGSSTTTPQPPTNLQVR